jgi:hypothetical protein
VKWVWVAVAVIVVGCGGNKTTAPSPTPGGPAPAPTPRPATLIGLAFDRPSLTGGQTATATVRLTSAAPDGGLAVSLSSSAGLLTVPASVTVPAGQASAEASISTSITPTDTTVTLTATAGGVIQTAKIDVWAQGVLDKFEEIFGNKYLYEKVFWQMQGTLRSPATSLTIIEPKSSSPAVLEPSGLMQIGPNSSQQRLELIAKPVADDTPVTISATSGGVTKTVEFVVTAPPAVRVISEPGDYVGLGKTQVQSNPGGPLGASGRALCGGRSLFFTVPAPGGGEWTFALGLPAGNTIHEGEYASLVGPTSDTSRPYFLVAINGRTCSVGTGRVVVDRVDYETTPSGRIHRFRGVFESRCENGAGLRAEISINDPQPPRQFADRCS